MVVMKRFLTLFFSTSFFFLSFSATASQQGTGLEIDNPELLQLVYTIDVDDVELAPLEAIVKEALTGTGIKLGQRKDAQLFLRIEEHADSYILYLDFSRKMQYRVAETCYSKDGYVWGRYAKNIHDTEQLHEDVKFFFEEFIQKYQSANTMR